jgi:hypothetical protein
MMKLFTSVDLAYQLSRKREKVRKAEDHLISEANRILKQQLLAEDRILQNLKLYKHSFEVLDEEEMDPGLIFTIAEIRAIAVTYRMKFLESSLFKPEIPYEAVLKLKRLNEEFKKELRFFFILSHPMSFRNKELNAESVLFVKTNADNYFMVHRWGTKMSGWRKVKYFPMQNFETLLSTILVFTLALTLSLPTAFITLDSRAEYWSGYRAAAFFHLLIFNLGMTAYVTFAFTKNFTASTWNRLKDFD